jgi:hypothetical protein
LDSVLQVTRGSISRRHCLRNLLIHTRVYCEQKWDNMPPPIQMLMLQAWVMSIKPRLGLMLQSCLSDNMQHFHKSQTHQFDVPKVTVQCQH